MNVVKQQQQKKNRKINKQQQQQNFKDSRDHAELRVPGYQNRTTRLISETKLVTPNFCFISETSISLSVCSRSFKKKLSSRKFSCEYIQNKLFLNSFKIHKLFKFTEYKIKH